MQTSNKLKCLIYRISVNNTTDDHNFLFLLYRPYFTIQSRAKKRFSKTGTTKLQTEYYLQKYGIFYDFYYNEFMLRLIQFMILKNKLWNEISLTKKRDFFFNFSTILLAFHNKYHVAKPNQILHSTLFNNKKDNVKYQHTTTNNTKNYFHTISNCKKIPS